MPKNDEEALSSRTIIEPLNDTNWETWSFVMEQYLTVNELWDVVSGAETAPRDPAAKAEFDRKQKSARARIALHVSSSQLSAVRLQTDPKDIWSELQRLNRPEGFGTRMALRREFSLMTKHPDMSMTKWITSVRDVARQIKDLKGDVLDEEIMVVLTNSLPDSYKPLVVHLDGMEDSKRTLSGVITRLIGEERRQAGETSANQEGHSLILHAVEKKRRDRSEVTCFGCGEKGHFRSECPASTKEPSSAKEHAAPEKSKISSGTLY